MDKKARIPLLVLNIISNVGLLAIIMILFVLFILIGAISGAFGGDPSLIIFKVYLMNTLFALVILLDILNIIIGFRKKPSGKGLSIAMICVNAFMIALFAFNCIYFLSLGQVSSESADTETILRFVYSIAIIVVYIVLYICNIVFIYIPRIKNPVENK